MPLHSAQAFVGLFDPGLDKRNVSILARMGSGSGADPFMARNMEG